MSFRCRLQTTQIIHVGVHACTNRTLGEPDLEDNAQLQISRKKKILRLNFLWDAGLGWGGEGERGWRTKERERRRREKTILVFIDGVAKVTTDVALILLLVNPLDDVTMARL